MNRLASLTSLCAFFALAACGGTADAGGGSPSADSPSGCAGSMVGEACHAGASCGAGLACDYANSNSTSMTCLKRAGACCESSAECMSGACEGGTCGLSPLDAPCEFTSDCDPSYDGQYGGSGVSCYNAPARGVCCPKNAHAGPPGCPGA
jgi:hypothetical protein